MLLNVNATTRRPPLMPNVRWKINIDNRNPIGYIRKYD